MDQPGQVGNAVLTAGPDRHVDGVQDQTGVHTCSGPGHKELYDFAGGPFGWNRDGGGVFRVVWQRPVEHRAEAQRGQGNPLPDPRARATGTPPKRYQRLS